MHNPPNFADKIRAVCFKESGKWVAVCLEHYIATQADSLNDLLYELDRTLVSYVAIAMEEGKQPFGGLPRTPQRYHEMWEEAERLPEFREIFEQKGRPESEVGLYLQAA